MKMLHKKNPFRIKKYVTEIFVYQQDYFPICPTCKIPLNREYQAYCDRCGQVLS